MSRFNDAKNIDPYIIIRGSSLSTGYLSTTPSEYYEIKMGVLGVKPYKEPEGENRDAAGGIKVATRWKRSMFKVVFQPHVVEPSTTIEDYSSYDYLLSVIHPLKYIWIMECNLERAAWDRTNYWKGTTLSPGNRVFAVEPIEENTSEVFEDGTDEVSVVYAQREILAADIIIPTS